LPCWLLGAVWSFCSPDFGVNGVIDRFGQIDPKVLIVCDGYDYNGKAIDCREKLEHLSARLPGVVDLVVVPVHPAKRDTRTHWRLSHDADSCREPADRVGGTENTVATEMKCPLSFIFFVVYRFRPEPPQVFNEQASTCLQRPARSPAAETAA
jgi:hypothetical protein